MAGGLEEADDFGGEGVGRAPEAEGGGGFEAEETGAKRRSWGDDGDGLALKLDFEAAAGRADEVVGNLVAVAKGDEAAEGDGGGGREGLTGQGLVGGEGGAEVGHETALALGEVSGLLGAHVVFAFGFAFFAGGLFAGVEGGAEEGVEFDFEGREEEGEKGGFVHSREYYAALGGAGNREVESGRRARRACTRLTRSRGWKGLVR